MKTKGQIWISAVLYIGLSVAVLAVVLSAGLPLINKMKDRNVILNTKQVLIDIDDSINTVSGEGPGSRRILSPVVIDKGELKIDSDKDILLWNFKTESQIIDISKSGKCLLNLKNLDPECIAEREGNVILFQEGTVVKGEFITYLALDYADLKDIKLEPAIPSDLKGRFTFAIQNDGTAQASTKTIITIKVT
jgi:hypothetical protein